MGTMVVLPSGSSSEVPIAMRTEAMTMVPKPMIT